MVMSMVVQIFVTITKVATLVHANLDINWKTTKGLVQVCLLHGRHANEIIPSVSYPVFHADAFIPSVSC